MRPLISVASKELTGSLNYLESTLTKNTGVGGGVMVNQKSDKDFCPERPKGVEGSFFSGFALGSLFSLFAQRVFHNSFAVNRFRTLSQNCRVYTNNSHFGLPRGCSKGSRRAVAAKGTQRPHEQALALTREAKQHTFRHRWNPSPSADEKPITCRG